MKTWTMPLVEIEAFVANEYVASTCSQSDVIPVSNKAYVYLDMNKLGDYNRNENSQRLVGANKVVYYTNPGFATGWYYEVPIYSANSPDISQGAYGSQYTSIDNMEYYGTFSVYVYNGSRLYIYKPGEEPSGSPDGSHAFS